jgi:hypothetical protein
MSNNSQRIKQILVIVATVGVIIINYLAGTGYINNRTPEFISDQYPTWITPAGYAFSIWGLIYLGLAAFSIYQALPKNSDRFVQLRSLYIQSCVANCLWLYLWHYDQILGSLAVMFVLLGILVLINLNLRAYDSKTDFWLVRVPFNIYFGWITVASILNATIALVYLGVSISTSVTTVLACVLLIVATVLGVLMRNNFQNAAYPLTVAWALTAIAVKQSGKTAIVTVAAFSVIALLFSALYGFVRSKDQPK